MLTRMALYSEPQSALLQTKYQIFYSAYQEEWATQDGTCNVLNAVKIVRAEWVSENTHTDIAVILLDTDTATAHTSRD